MPSCHMKRGCAALYQKMAIQVEPGWAIWVEYQRNQSQLELFPFEYFRFPMPCDPTPVCSVGACDEYVMAWWSDVHTVMG